MHTVGDLGTAPERHTPAATANRQTFRALELLAVHYRDPGQRIRAVARVLRLSPAHLAKLVRRATGISLRQHGVRLRMQAAARHLFKGSLSVKEVAAEVGYSGTSGLDHEFRKHFGCSPREWQRRAWRSEAVADALAATDRASRQLIAASAATPAP